LTTVASEVEIFDEALKKLVKNMIEYPNWFAPVGAIDYSSKYFIFFGLMLGGYFNLKFKFKKINPSNG
jgi:hypothetical protein